MLDFTPWLAAFIFQGSIALLSIGWDLDTCVILHSVVPPVLHRWVTIADMLRLPVLLLVPHMDLVDKLLIILIALHRHVIVLTLPRCPHRCQRILFSFTSVILLVKDRIALVDAGEELGIQFLIGLPLNQLCL